MKDSKKARALALDVGRKRVGIALSDPERIIAQPLSTLVIKSTLDVASREIHELCMKQGVDTIVVGLPLELSGESGPQTAFTKKFVDILIRNICKDASLVKKVSDSITQAGDISVVFFDERFSSVEASRVLNGSGLVNEKRREAKDAITASLLLEAYLQSS